MITLSVGQDNPMEGNHQQLACPPTTYIGFFEFVGCCFELPHLILQSLAEAAKSQERCVSNSPSESFTSIWKHNVLTMFCMRVKFNSRARMLNTRLHERKYWIRCCYASNCVLNASSYSERCGYDVFMNINERLSPVYPITLRHVTSLFVTLSPQTRPDAAFTLT